MESAADSFPKKKKTKITQIFPPLANLKKKKFRPIGRHGSRDLWDVVLVCKFP